MEDSKELEEQESKKNISDLWLEKVYGELLTLEDYEREMKNGFLNLQELVSTLTSANYGGILAMAKVQSYNLLITEWEILIPDISPILPSEKLEKLEKQFVKLRDLSLNKEKPLFRFRKNEHGVVIGIQWNLPSLEFQNLTGTMRRELILNLKHLLFVQENKNPTPKGK